MVQKIKWEGTKDWNEWLWIWERNEKGEFSKDGKPNSDIARGLLFAGPKVHCDSIRKDGSGAKDSDKVKFYLKIAWWDDSSSDKQQRSIGKKAYQILVTKLLPDFRQAWITTGWRVASKESEELIKKIIEFFAYSKRYFFTDEKPYRSAGKNFVKRLYLGIKSDSHESSFSPESRKILLKQEKEIAKALMNLDSYDFILLEEIFGAITVLEDKIVDHLWNELLLIDATKKEFPGGAGEFREALEDFDWRAFVFAFKHSGKEARVLYELLAKQMKKVR